MKGVADPERATAEAWEENPDLGKQGGGHSTVPISGIGEATGYCCEVLAICRAMYWLLAGGAPNQHPGGLSRGKACRPCG